MPNARAKRIDKAGKEAKKRDRFQCRRCKIRQEHGAKLEAAHLLVRNAPYSRFRPDDARFIIALCQRCHNEMDRNSNPTAKAQWLRDNDLPQPAGMIEYAIGERDEPSIEEVA